MKQFGVFILILLMFVPPVQAHADAIVFADEVDTHHIETLDDHHQQEHHKNDTEDHKNSKHHHHCTSLGFTSAIITPINICCSLIKVTQVKKSIHYYQKTFGSNYLDTLIQPPQV